MSFYDSNLDGQVGEQLYIDYLKANNIKFIDVRNDIECQQLDIDFIIPHGNNTKDNILKYVRHAQFNDRTQRQQKIGYTVEVKLDKVTHNRYITKNGDISNGTGNLVYELISHNIPGCLARSYADFILYICVDTFDEYTTLKKVYMINLFNWRNLMTQNNNLNMRLKPIAFVVENNKPVKEDILNILCPVQNLLQYNNVIKDVTKKFEKFFPNNLILKN